LNNRTVKPANGQSAAELNPAFGLNWSTELSTRVKKIKNTKGERKEKG
jgi:hypothetical protein